MSKKEGTKLTNKKRKEGHYRAKRRDARKEELANRKKSKETRTVLKQKKKNLNNSDHSGSRTHDLLIRSQTR